MNHKDLKIGVYTSPQSGTLEFERYVVEDETDLDNFREKFPQINVFKMYDNFKKALSEGHTILLTDEHRLTGMPTYCFESKTDKTHPSSMNRVKLIKED
jgi:hypothetical protein